MWAGNEEGSTVLGGWEQSWLPQQWDVCVGGPLARSQSKWEDTSQSQSHGSATQAWL